MDTVDLKTVREQADKLGITYHHKAGAPKIAAMVAAHLAENPADALKLYEGGLEIAESGVSEVTVDPEAPIKDTDFEKMHPKGNTRADGAECPVKPLNAAEFRKTQVGDRVKGIKALRRVRIQCMNPAKREWPGEIISVGSAKHGTYKKFIPFDGEPYHIPQIIYDVLKEKKCTLFRTVRNHDGRGGTKREGYLADEFAIQDLPPLTREELEELAEKQALAKAGL